MGLQSAVKLYPSASPYEGDTWGIAVMLPEEDYSTDIDKTNQLLYGAVTGLLVISLLLAYFISRRYIQPIVDTLHLIRNETIDSLQKTNIAEIDDLLEFLAAQDERRKALEPAGSPDLAPYMEFKRSIETLSKAERSVFNLYMRGHKAKDIADILSVSMNTIKTHNRHIYTKLNVTSRKELMVYVQMMSAEAGKE